MKVNYNQFLSLVYSDIFDYPLTREEMRLWSLSKDSHGLVTPACRQGSDFRGYDKFIENRNGYYFLKGRERIVGIRQKREKISQIKLVKLVKIIKLVKLIPTVEGIFVTGSVAAKNAKEDADLDVLIVTSANCLWMTRGIVLMLLKGLKILRSKNEIADKICPNIFLDLSHLEINEKNLYTAHEVMQTKCVFDRGGVERKWLVENGWVREFLPNAFKKRRTQTEIRRNDFWGFLRSVPGFLVPLELLAYIFQYLYMSRKITNERVGWGFAFFHPDNLSNEILEKFEMKIKKLKLVI